MHENSRIAFEQKILPLIPDGTVVLDVGAPRGNSGNRIPLTAKGCDYWYSDLSNKGRGNKIAWIDAYRMDCPDNRFDAVVTSQTLEHVEWIWSWVKELARVVKPGGIVASISPITWAIHRHPVDCWRVFPDGGACLLRWVGLEVVLAETARFEDGQHDAQYQMSGVGPVEDLVLIGKKPAPVQ